MQMKRSFDPAVLEMMDRPQPVSAELDQDLKRIRQLNRWFGSYRLVLNFIRRWIEPGAQMRIVDLATGSADIPRLIVDYARQIGSQVEIDALDRQPATLEIARKLSTGYPEISYYEANILEWNSPEAYDIVLCTLSLHHFSDEDAVRLLRRCRELSRRFVLVSDLRRGFLLNAGVHLLTTLIFREPMTRHDARLSAARAFSFSEMRTLAKRADWESFGHKRFRFARQAIWLDGRPNTALDDFAFEAVLRTNVQAESSHAAPETRSDILPLAKAGDAGPTGKVRLRRGVESSRQQTQ
jgi:2-polyprenyl-3-methyl-5-hydroxy-6-metoxy-1,4-benzoquinol methylase